MRIRRICLPKSFDLKFFKVTKKLTKFSKVYLILNVLNLNFKFSLFTLKAKDEQHMRLNYIFTLDLFILIFFVQKVNFYPETKFTTKTLELAIFPFLIISITQSLANS